jgi:hypothetical protein
VSVLAEYPLEVISRVCDPRVGLPAKSKWLPTIFEVKEECDAAMAPIVRRQREEKALAERRRALAAPTYKRPTMAELKAKYGENWGMTAVESKTHGPRPLGDLIREAGISAKDFEALNDRAKKHQDEFLAAHPEWRR